MEPWNSSFNRRSKNDPEGTPVSIHPSGVPYPPLHVCYNFMILIAEAPSRRTEYRRYLGNAGLNESFPSCIFSSMSRVHSPIHQTPTAFLLSEHFRHSPYTIQIRGNRTTFPPPRELYPPMTAIRWHDFGNRPALGRPLGHFSRHPDTPLLSLSPRRRFPRPTPERVFVADHQSSSGFSGTGPSAPPPQPIGT